MRSLLKTLAILLLMALIPLRGMAAATVGFCPSGLQDMAVAAQAEHGHSANALAHDAHDSAPQSEAPPCNVCAEHCSSAAFALSVGDAYAARPFGNDRTQFSARGGPTSVSDVLDRPPLS